MRTHRTTILALLALFATGLTACNDPDALGPDDDPDRANVFVLNSVGQTIGTYHVSADGLSFLGSIVLPENFDGVSVDLADPIYATTISALGGSRIVVGSVDSGEQVTISFPGTNPGLVDPGKATLSTDFLGDVAIWTAGRRTNALYRATPEFTEAQLLVEDIGEFVERVLPSSEQIVLVDGNLDDAGGTFEPLGDSRITVVNVNSLTKVAEIDLPGAFGATDGIFADDQVLVLAAGTFGENFAPNGDGRLVLVNPGGREVGQNLELGGNGIAMEPSRDGNIYVTRTSDFVTTDVVVYNAFTRSWVRSPEDPIIPRDAAGARVNCWAAVALQDGRLLCVTFSVPPQEGRLYLMDASGQEIESLPAGFGTTDIATR